MKRIPRAFLVLFPLAILIGSCVGTEAPTGVGVEDVSLAFPINPALIPSPADAGAAAINRIRVRVHRTADDVQLGEAVIDVDPVAEEWEVTVDATVRSNGDTVTVYVSLLHVEGAEETVQFSGLAGPLALQPGEITDATDIPIVRGPIENLFVTGLTITTAPDTIMEGATATLEGDATTSSESPPTIFWTVLDSTVLSATDADLTGLMPGIGQVVASAGAFTDTATIVVTQAPASVVVTPDTAFVGIGEQATFSAIVLDARGDTIVGESVDWSSGTPSIVTSAGGGAFEGLAAGEGLVQAAAASDATAVGTAVVVVAGGPPPGPDVTISLEVADPTPAEGDTVQVTVTVTNDPGTLPTDVTNLVVMNAAEPGLAVVASAPTQGTFDAQTGTWTVGGIAIDESASLTLDLEVPIGAPGSTLTDSAWVASLDQAQSDVSNDTASVDLVVQQQQANVAVLKTVDEPQPLEDSTVVFTVSVVNEGNSTASDVVVFDTLPPEFLTPVQQVSVGTLVGDSLWSIPVLAPGDTATWTTTTVVATGVGGGSATNTALIRGIAQNDTTPANDTAVVVMSFPVSAVPVVQITAPPDGSVYDPGDLVSFVAVANDAEEGDLSPSIEWTSDVDGVLATGRSFETDQLTTGVHFIAASVTDQDAGTGADTIQITVALITTPTTLNVPFGGTASLPVTLSEPAPAGGFTLTVSSADDQITTPTTSSVFIPGGALSANVTLQGLQPGTVDVTVSNPQFGASVTSVSVTAELDVLVTNLTVPQTFPQPVTIQLESVGVPIAAPPGGLDVTLTSLDPTCATGPATITIPEGLVSETATISYGGSAQLNCTAYVRATAAAVVPDSVRVTVTPTPSFSISALTVGSGLQYGNFWAGLGTTVHGGVTVRLESEDPSTMLVSPNSSTPGTPFIDVFVPNGQNRANYYVQGVEGTTGTASFVASAPGFATDSALITVVPPAIDLVGLNPNTTTFSPDDAFWARTGVPNATETALQLNQAIRAGGDTLTVTVTSSAPGIGDLITLPDSASPVTVAIAPGQLNSGTSVANDGVAFEPLTAGTTTVSATAPGMIQTDNAVLDVAVSAPTISINGTTVGAGLQYGNFAAVLGATDHGGVTVTLTSADPSVMLVAPDGNTPGAASITVDVAQGQNRANYYVQGVEGQTGVVPLNVSAPGFVANSADITVVQPGFDIVALNATTTTLTIDDPFYVRAGVPNGQATALSIVQAVRSGGQALTATVTSSAPTVADLVTLPDSASPVDVVMQPGQSNTPVTVATGGVALEPLTAGVTTVSATIPGLIQTNNAVQSVTVSAPGISLAGTSVGSGLQYGNFSAGLGATDHGGVTVTLTSQDPSVMLVSPNSTTAGTASIDVVLQDGERFANYYVHGVEGQTGVIPLTVSAPGFNSNSADITVVQPAFDISALDVSPTTFSANDPFTVRVGLPNGQQTALSLLQAVRTGGTTFTATVTSSNLGVGELETTLTTGGSVTAQIAPGATSTPTTLANGGIEFDPLGNGTTNVVASIPGFIQTDNGARVVNVSSPGISVPSMTVGAGLQYGNFQAVLGATGHGGVTVTLTSSNPSVFLISPNGTTAGTPSIDVVVPDGQNRANFYVHGVEGAEGTASITVTANGFTDGSGTATVVPPALDLISISTSYSAGANDDVIQVRLGVPTANNTGISIQQALRFGASPLTVTLTSDNTAAAQLVTTATSGGSVDVVLQPAEARSPTTVAAGGVALDPIAVGSTTIQATAPNFITTTAGIRVVTITP